MFITSTGDCPGSNRFEISGTLGKIVLENGVLKHWRLLQDEREVCRTSTENFCKIDTEYNEYSDKKEEGHKGILQNFANAILNGAELIAPGYEGINELTISNVAYLSEWTGNRQIDIPFDTDLFDSMLSEKAKKSIYSEKSNKNTQSKDYNERWKVRW